MVQYWMGRGASPIKKIILWLLKPIVSHGAKYNRQAETDRAVHADALVIFFDRSLRVFFSYRVPLPT